MLYYAWKVDSTILMGISYQTNMKILELPSITSKLTLSQTMAYEVSIYDSCTDVSTSLNVIFQSPVWA